MSKPVELLEELVLKIGEDAIIPLLDALLRRDVPAAERHARAIAETDIALEALDNTPGRS